jgi:hypothetical protein
MQTCSFGWNKLSRNRIKKLTLILGTIFFFSFATNCITTYDLKSGTKGKLTVVEHFLTLMSIPLLYSAIFYCYREISNFFPGKQRTKVSPAPWSLTKF